MIALIDSDVLCYRSGFAVESKLPDGTIELEPLSHAFYNVDTTIHSILKATKADDYTLYLTGKDNFRDKIATVRPYKGNRDKQHRPIYYDEIREYMIDKHSAIVVDGMEADDALSIAQYTDYLAANSLIKNLREDSINKSFIKLHRVCETIIATIDKDLMMVPGWNYNWVTDKLMWRTEDECHRFFHTQLLTGDITDNIVGVPGIGAVKAKQILDKADETGEAYICAIGKEYAKSYEDPERILIEMGQLLWMKRSEKDMWNL
jgi:5'-3' exonuclease